MKKCMIAVLLMMVAITNCSNTSSSKNKPKTSKLKTLQDSSAHKNPYQFLPKTDTELEVLNNSKKASAYLATVSPQKAKDQESGVVRLSSQTSSISSGSDNSADNNTSEKTDTIKKQKHIKNGPEQSCLPGACTIA